MNEKDVIIIIKSDLSAHSKDEFEVPEDANDLINGKKN